MKTIFFHPSGPMLRYGAGQILVDDLNPQIQTKWYCSRVAMLGIAWRCIVAAIWH